MYHLPPQSGLECMAESDPERHAALGWHRWVIWFRTPLPGTPLPACLVRQPDVCAGAGFVRP